MRQKKKFGAGDGAPATGLPAHGKEATTDVARNPEVPSYLDGKRKAVAGIRPWRELIDGRDSAELPAVAHED